MSYEKYESWSDRKPASSPWRDIFKMWGAYVEEAAFVSYFPPLELLRSELYGQYLHVRLYVIYNPKPLQIF